MKKRTYIQPEMEMMVIPAEALMDPITIPGSGQGPTDPGSGSGAPKRRIFF